MPRFDSIRRSKPKLSAIRAVWRCSSCSSAPVMSTRYRTSCRPGFIRRAPRHGPGYKVPFPPPCGSLLALTQTGYPTARASAPYPGIAFEVRLRRSSGDDAHDLFMWGCRTPVTTGDATMDAELGCTDDRETQWPLGRTALGAAPGERRRL